jgi:hypothetical protein
MCYGVNRNSKASTGFGCTNWAPTEIENITVWLDGNDPLGTGKQPQDGEPVPLWKDKSGKGRNAQAGSKSNAPGFCDDSCVIPTYERKLSIANNKGSILQSGNRIYVLPAFDPSPISTSKTPGSPTIFAVISANNPNAYNLPWLTVNPPNWTYFYLYHYAQGGGNGCVGFTNGYNTLQRTIAPPGTAINTPTIVSLTVSDPNNSTAPLYRTSVNINGNQFVDPVYGNGIPATAIWTDSTYTSVRGFFSGPQIQLILGQVPGYVHELIMYDRALTDDERAKVEGYLAWKWGKQDSLPPDHPYTGGEP